MSLAPARTVAPCSSIEPAAASALARNFSNVLRACSRLVSAIDRISFGISKRSRTSFMVLLLLVVLLLFSFAPQPVKLHRCDARHSPVSRFLNPVARREVQQRKSPKEVRPQS